MKSSIREHGRCGHGSVRCRLSSVTQSSIYLIEFRVRVKKNPGEKERKREREKERKREKEKEREIGPSRAKVN